MQSYGKPALPTLRLERLKKNVQHQQNGLATHRAAGDTTSSRRKPTKPQQLTGRSHRQPQPPQHRRGYGFTGLVADGTAQTHRPAKTHTTFKKPVAPTEPMTARPPTNEKRNRPRSNHRHHRESSELKVAPLPSNVNDVPMTPSQALKANARNLSGYEQGEILDYPQVWYMGSAENKLMNKPSSNAHNFGYDDERGDYNIKMHDHISYRYEILGPLGKGSFGQVVKCLDHKTNSVTALKLIRNKKRFHHQALVEVKLLQYCKERDPHDQANLVHMDEYFYFRNHLCITFELMSINLYELIKNNNFVGLSLGLIRRFAVQLLSALRALKKLRIIHCDLKPENILLRQPNKSGIKIIDFGSSCFEDERIYTYIQSRFYRSPEVILGLPYDTAIDMWSFGCILAELYTGYPLFPGENEMEQMACIMEVFGKPPSELVDISSRRKMFFESSGQPRIVPNSRGKKRRPGTKQLGRALDCQDHKFVHFLECCLRWDPRERFTPEDAIQHEWILEGLQPVPPAQTSARSSRASNKALDSDKPHANPKLKDAKMNKQHNTMGAKRLPQISKRGA